MLFSPGFVKQRSQSFQITQLGGKIRRSEFRGNKCLQRSQVAISPWAGAESCGAVQWYPSGFWWALRTIGAFKIDSWLERLRPNCSRMLSPVAAGCFDRFLPLAFYKEPFNGSTISCLVARSFFYRIGHTAKSTRRTSQQNVRFQKVQKQLSAGKKSHNGFLFQFLR